MYPLSVILGSIYEKMSLSSINWRAREQARKQAAEDAVRRRAVEVSEISFPSLTSSTEWGSSPSSSDAARRTWAHAAPSVKNDERTESDTTSSSSKAMSSYAPPVIISRAKIASEIRNSRMSTRYDDYDDRYYEESSSQNPLIDGDGWQEVTTRKRSTAPPPPTTRTHMDQPQYDDDDEEDY